MFSAVRALINGIYPRQSAIFQFLVSHGNIADVDRQTDRQTYRQTEREREREREREMDGWMDGWMDA